uniref:L-xylulose reductase n=1 Tax=Caenorhabditis japonica TaxID=281687 RepID=A0A8R1HXC4_CAEJA
MQANYDFTDRRILVTGASQGIGREICVSLAKSGAQVIAFARNEANLKSLVKESASLRHTIIPIIGDVSANEEVLFKLIFPHFPIHGLVNNAGIACNHAIGQITQQSIDRTFAVNVRGPILISQLVARNFVDRQIKGSIVNVSSQAAIRPLDNHTVYCSSKAALDMVTRCLANELGSQNIRVNSVNPTVVMTDMGRDNWNEPEKKKKMLDRMPIKRFAEVDEVVNAVLFLLSDASSMTTGSSLPVDGGFSNN